MYVCFGGSVCICIVAICCVLYVVDISLCVICYHGNAMIIEQFYIVYNMGV